MMNNQMEPALDPWREREQGHRPANRYSKVAALAMAAAIGLVACSGPGDTPRSKNAATPGPAEAPETTAKEIATSFLQAYGAFDADRAITYLADGADLSGLGAEGTREFRMLLSFLEAQGYKQMLTPCEETGSSSAGT